MYYKYDNGTANEHLNRKLFCYSSSWKFADDPGKSALIAVAQGVAKTSDARTL